MIVHMDASASARHALKAAGWSHDDVVARMQEKCPLTGPMPVDCEIVLGDGVRLSAYAQPKGGNERQWEGVVVTTLEKLISGIATFRRLVASPPSPIQVGEAGDDYDYTPISQGLIVEYEREIAEAYPAEFQTYSLGRQIGKRWGDSASDEDLQRVKPMWRHFGVDRFGDPKDALTLGELVAFSILPGAWESRDTDAAARFWTQTLRGECPLETSNQFPFLRGFLDGIDKF